MRRERPEEVPARIAGPGDPRAMVRQVSGGVK